MCVISGFRREVDEICALPSYYAASSGSFLPTFRENIGPIFRGQSNRFILGSWPPEDGTETSVRNYHYSLRNNPDERSSQLCVFLCVFIFVS